MNLDNLLIYSWFVRLKVMFFYRKMIFLLVMYFLINTLNAGQHHFYVGANVGAGGFSAKTSDVVESTSLVSKTFNSNKYIKSNSTIGGLYLGYLLRLHNFGLGTEISWQYANLEKTLDGKFDDVANGDHLDFVIRNKLTGQVEFSIRPGYFISNYFTYVILGLNAQNMYYNYSAKGSRGGNPVQSSGDKKSKYVKGYTFGAGVQKNIYENIVLGIELKVSKLFERNYQFQLPSDPALFHDISISSKLKNIQTYSCCLRFMYTF